MVCTARSNLDLLEVYLNGFALECCNSVNDVALFSQKHYCVVRLIYKHSLDINVENFTITLETIISSLNPNYKTYIMGDFNINLLDYNSVRIEKFSNQIISRIFFPCNNSSDPSHSHQLHFDR